MALAALVEPITFATGFDFMAARPVLALAALVEPYSALATFAVHGLVFALAKDAVVAEAATAQSWAKAAAAAVAGLRPLAALAGL